MYLFLYDHVVGLNHVLLCILVNESTDIFFLQGKEMEMTCRLSGLQTEQASSTLLEVFAELDYSHVFCVVLLCPGIVPLPGFPV